MKIININDLGNSPLTIALKRKNYELINFLINDSRVDLTSYNNEFFDLCCRKNEIDLIKRLLKDYNIDPSYPDNRHVRRACLGNKLELLNILLEDLRVSFNYDHKCRTFPLVCHHGYIEIIKRLLQDPRIDPSLDDNEAIKYAYEADKQDIVDLLLKDPRVNPNEVESYEELFKNDN